MSGKNDNVLCCEVVDFVKTELGDENDIKIETVGVGALDQSVAVSLSDFDTNDAGEEQVAEHLIVDAELKFIKALQAAKTGGEIIDATQRLNTVDKKSCSLAYNRAKKVLLSRNLLDERFARGGYGGMSRKDRCSFLTILASVGFEVVQELKHVMIPANTKSQEYQNVLTDNLSRNHSTDSVTLPKPTEMRESNSNLTTEHSTVTSFSATSSKQDATILHMNSCPSVGPHVTFTTGHSTALSPAESATIQALSYKKKRMNPPSVTYSDDSLFYIHPTVGPAATTPTSNFSNSTNSMTNDSAQMLPPSVASHVVRGASGDGSFSASTAQAQAVLEANAELIRQQTLNVKAQRLAEAMRDPSFASLPPDKQEAIRSLYVDSVLGV